MRSKSQRIIFPREDLTVDSDLVEAIENLTSVLNKHSTPCTLGQAPESLLKNIEKQYDIPPRYRSFLAESNPIKLEVALPIEAVEIFSAEELLQEQVDFTLKEDLSPLPASDMGSWRKSWVVIGRSIMLGDPYFIDTSKADAEGDCPVYSAMSGTERWDPDLVASSLVQFLQVLTAGLQVAEGFGEADVGIDDEDLFREALAPRIRTIDPVALRAGHWT